MLLKLIATDALLKRSRKLFLLAFAAAMVGMAAPAQTRAADNEAALWQALRSGGHLALMRHAIAPGTGDPANFVLGACETQRNLSDDGRAQARRAGDLFRANGIDRAALFSSEWCRCQDTAALMDLGIVTGLPALNSFFQRPENREPQLQALRAWLASRTFGEPHVLVTHQVIITALTGVYPRSGQIVVVRRSESGDLTVVGNIQTN
jgi:phosphohistidine phosphatase SixA